MMANLPSPSSPAFTRRWSNAAVRPGCRCLSLAPKGVLRGRLDRWVVVTEHFVIRAELVRKATVAEEGTIWFMAQIVADGLDIRLAFPDGVDTVVRVADLSRRFVVGYLPQLNELPHSPSQSVD